MMHKRSIITMLYASPPRRSSMIVNVTAVHDIVYGEDSWEIDIK